MAVRRLQPAAEPSRPAVLATSERSLRARRFDEYGIVIVEWALTGNDLTLMAAAFAAEARGRRPAAMPRDLLDGLDSHRTLQALANELSGGATRLVRAVAIEETSAANWFAPWHQDRTIVAGHPRPKPGFDGRDARAGMIHVEPPLWLRETMVTLHIHIDACHEDNGPLEVIPGSHSLGRLDHDAIQTTAAERPSALCLTGPGDIVAMHPLLVHRSQRARRPARRRVLQLGYATAGLPEPLALARLTETGTA